MSVGGNFLCTFISQQLAWNNNRTVAITWPFFSFQNVSCSNKTDMSHQSRHLSRLWPSSIWRQIGQQQKSHTHKRHFMNRTELTTVKTNKWWRNCALFVNFIKNSDAEKNKQGGKGKAVKYFDSKLSTFSSPLTKTVPTFSAESTGVSPNEPNQPKMDPECLHGRRKPSARAAPSCYPPLKSWISPPEREDVSNLPVSVRARRCVERHSLGI